MVISYMLGQCPKISEDLGICAFIVKAFLSIIPVKLFLLQIVCLGVIVRRVYMSFSGHSFPYIGCYYEFENTAIAHYIGWGFLFVGTSHSSCTFSL